jgi:hypothetical protein
MALLRDARHHLYHVSNTTCAAYMRGHVNRRFQEFPAMPNKTFTIKLSAREASFVDLLILLS